MKAGKTITMSAGELVKAFRIEHRLVLENGDVHGGAIKRVAYRKHAVSGRNNKFVVEIDADGLDMMVFNADAQLAVSSEGDALDVMGETGGGYGK